MKTKIICSIALLSIGIFALNSCGNGSNNDTTPLQPISPAYDGDDVSFLEYDKPLYNENNNTITYGLYPQSVVTDKELLGYLDEHGVKQENGWYSFLHNYYVKVNSVEADLVFTNGEVSKSKTAYWFKCEPIVWKILEVKNSDYFVVSEKLLDLMTFVPKPASKYVPKVGDVPGNNYEYCEIRGFLNGLDGEACVTKDYSKKGFLKVAFPANDTYIQTVTVDNSPETTDSINNGLVNDTRDKIFLLSYKELLSAKYGFTDDESRKCKLTDYAISHAPAQTKDHLGFYWTRSQMHYSTATVSMVYPAGQLEHQSVAFPKACIRPAMHIVLNK